MPLHMFGILTDLTHPPKTPELARPNPKTGGHTGSILPCGIYLCLLFKHQIKEQYGMLLFVCRSLFRTPCHNKTY